jgi:DNA polymerase-3 subunit delta
MAKSKFNGPSISQIINDLKKNKLLPVYFLFGEDSFSIDSAIALIENYLKPLIDSDFDRETFYGEDKNLNGILDFAAAFPFGSGKKLIIIKDFEKIKDKKPLTAFINSPPEFLVMIITLNGSITNFESEPYKTLTNKNFMFEAKELKGKYLITWLKDYSRAKGKNLNSENAQFLVDIVGEDRSMLEAQLEKIFVYLGEVKEITIESIQSLSTSLKEYNIFSLQNAIGKKNKSDSVKIINNMLDNGINLTYIIYMLTRYFSGLSRIKELNEKKVHIQAAAKIVGANYYYNDYLNARSRYSDKDLYKAAQALLKADLSIKTSIADDKTVVTIMLAEIMQ